MAGAGRAPRAWKARNYRGRWPGVKPAQAMGILLGWSAASPRLPRDCGGFPSYALVPVSPAGQWVSIVAVTNIPVVGDHAHAVVLRKFPAPSNLGLLTFAGANPWCVVGRTEPALALRPIGAGTSIRLRFTSAAQVRPVLENRCVKRRRVCQRGCPRQKLGSPASSEHKSNEKE